MELYEPSITSALEDQKRKEKGNDFTILSVDPVARSCHTWQGKFSEVDNLNI